MNTESVDCVRRDYPSAADFVAATGDFCWGPEAEGIRRLYIRLPGTSTACYDALKCFRGTDRGIKKEWGWDGNKDKPTLTPSILNHGEWHGHLVAGRLVSC